MIRRGSPSRRPIAVADTASGGATIAPSTSAAARVSSGTVVIGDEADGERRRQWQPDREPADRPDVLAQAT